MKTTMKNTKNKSDKKELVKRLSGEYEELLTKSKSKYSERVYMNLPVTRIERVFFKLFAERLSIDKTKLLRRIICKLMDRYPSIVEESKAIIDAGLDINSNGDSL